MLEMKPIIVPAIIARIQAELDGILERLKGKVGRVMLDVMDGRFVENTSLDFDFKLPAGFEYEAHLMVVNPLSRVEGLTGKVCTAILHVEALEDISTAIEYVKDKGLDVMLALNPETKVEVVMPHLSEVDGILVMTVAPGRYGGRFQPDALNKVRRIREVDEDIPIEVDGGMTPDNARAAREAGANIFASGSYILKSNDVSRALQDLEREVKKMPDN
jgi:ribulose-phosphate 3-epimerase